MDLLDNILGAGQFIPVNPTLAAKIGVPQAAFVSYVLYLRRQSKVKGPCDPFPVSIAELEKVGFTRATQGTIIKKLGEAGILTSQLMGNPAKRHIRFLETSQKVVMGVLMGSGTKVRKKAQKKAQKPQGEVKKINVTFRLFVEWNNVHVELYPSMGSFVFGDLMEKDQMGLRNIGRRIPIYVAQNLKIQKSEVTPQQVIEFWKEVLQNIKAKPGWRTTNGFSPSMIYSQFDGIIREIYQDYGTDNKRRGQQAGKPSFQGNGGLNHF